MRILLSLTAILLLGTQISFAQKKGATPVHRAVERMLAEKVKHFDLEAALEWVEQHPGQALPASLSTFNNGDRSGETLVSGNELAESEVHAAINPVDSNNIIVSAIAQDPNSTGDILDIPIRYTTNFGQTWQTSNVVFSPGGGFLTFVAGGGDPVIAFDKSGKAYISWLVLTFDLGSEPPIKLALYSSTSTNKGQSWSAPTLIDEGALTVEVLTGGLGSGSLVDKQWMATDQSNTPSEGNLYVAYTKFDIIDSVTSTAQILLKRKLKTSATYSTTPVQVHTNIYPFVQFSSIDVDAEGEIHVSFFAGSTPSNMGLYHTFSTDAGLTFKPETLISYANYPSYIDTLAAVNPIEGVDDGRLYPCPHLRVGKDPGVLYAVWSADGQTSQLTQGYDVWFSKSVNNGTNWSAPKRINPGIDLATHQFYPALAVSPTGVICISYYDRSSANSAQTHYAVTYSLDDGATFSAPVNATTVPSDFTQIGALNEGFGIGEYTQIICAPNTAIPVWADGRENNGNIDLYAAFLPISNGPFISSVDHSGVLSSDVSVTVPSPARTQAVIQVELSKTSNLHVRMFATDGRLVFEEKSTTPRSAGTYTNRVPLKPGLYLCHVETEFGFVTKKVTVF